MGLGIARVRARARARVGDLEVEIEIDRDRDGGSRTCRPQSGAAACRAEAAPAVRARSLGAWHTRTRAPGRVSAALAGAGGRTRAHAGARGRRQRASANNGLPFDRKWRTQGCQSRRGAPTSIHFVQRRSLGGRSRPRCAACVQGPEGRRYRRASTTGGESEGRPRSHTEELTGREASRRDAHRRALSPCQLARPVQATLDSAAT